MDLDTGRVSLGFLGTKRLIFRVDLGTGALAEGINRCASRVSPAAA